MKDKYAKFEIEIQLVHACRGFNDDSVYTVNKYKIYSNNLGIILVCKKAR